MVVLSVVAAAAVAAEGFAWGTATASYQIEGGTTRDGRQPSIWDTFCTQPPYPCHDNNTGEPADDSYDKYKTDSQLMVNLGITHYRLSFAWPRIFPDGRTLNQKGIDHYKGVVRDLRSKGIEPLVTLYHWDMPQAVYDATSGGWINRTMPEYFVRYAETVFEHFIDDVKFWLTFNEPLTFCNVGYGGGAHAPGRCTGCAAGGDTTTEPYLCAHNVLRSHAAVYRLFRKKGYNEKAKLGITLNTDFAMPATESEADREAAERYMVWQAAWYADPIYTGDYPAVMKDFVGDRLPAFTPEEKIALKGSSDFYGLNHYTTKWAQAAPKPAAGKEGWSTDQRNNIAPINQVNSTAIGLPAASPWLWVVPYGLHNILTWVSKRYGYPPVYVTENGCDVPGENTMPIDQALNDTFRVDFYKGYTAQALKAKAEGVQLKGYFAWSMMDNFEWADGYQFRFGLHYVDYSSPDLPRYPKASAKWFRDFTKANPDPPQGSIPPQGSTPSA
eukprot:Hpha_TRINITY_DN17289_c0_g1::TRINITY_DN17289_c0_g1_i1::g.17848::m.17848/K01188/E3.2.1.21; beta-glucosidase